MGLQLRGVREELRVEKERNKAISEHVGLLKESVDQKQTAVLEMKRKVRKYTHIPHMCTHTHTVAQCLTSMPFFICTVGQYALNS